MRHLLVRVSRALLIVSSLYSLNLSADQTGRMSVSVIASGSDSTRSEGEWSTATFSYKAAFSTTLQSDGELSDINMYDPEFTEKMIAMANANMAKIQAALNGEFTDEEDEAEPDYRYLLFMGQMDCPSTVSVVVDERVEGEYADVGGMQPYTMTFAADYSGTSMELSMLCVASNSVLDTTENVLYRSTLGFPEVTGHYIYHETNRGNLQDNPQARHNALPQFISDYVFSTLQVAPASGHVKTTLKPTAPVVARVNSFGGYEGSVDVEITWAMELSE